MMKSNLNYYIEKYFKEYLPKTKGLSRLTILSYRDTFKLLLEYIESNYKIDINNIKLNDIDYNLIVSFLNYLEEHKKNSISTRNQRLAAIHSFFYFLHLRELTYYDTYSQILSIPIKKAPKNTIAYFSLKEIEILLNMPNPSNKYGFRDYILLFFMYETGARVSEVANVTKNQFHFDQNNNYVILIGKGNKERKVPITNNLVKILYKYFNVFNI